MTRPSVGDSVYRRRRLPRVASEPGQTATLLCGLADRESPKAASSPFWSPWRRLEAVDPMWGAGRWLRPMNVAPWGCCTHLSRSLCPTLLNRMCFTNPSLQPAGAVATEAQPLAEGRCGHPRTHSPPTCPSPEKQPSLCSLRPFLFRLCSAPACGLSARAGAPGGERAAWPGLLSGSPCPPCSRCP